MSDEVVTGRTGGHLPGMITVGTVPDAPKLIALHYSDLGVDKDGCGWILFTSEHARKLAAQLIALADVCDSK